MLDLLLQVHDDEAFYYLGRCDNIKYFCKRKHLFFNEEKGMYDCLPKNVIKKKTNEKSTFNMFLEIIGKIHNKKD